LHLDTFTRKNMIRLLVSDMAGTTVCDNDEVLFCFRKACLDTGILASDERLNALMGVSKLEVFHLLWGEQLSAREEKNIPALADSSYRHFCVILENYYLTHPVVPTEGALDVFEWCRRQGIRVALNTGFYRKVTDIILEKLDWRPGREIDLVITSDEVPQGRPAPFMIRKAMAHFGFENPLEVVKVGDTPVDLAEGRNAGCLFSIAVTNGTHRADQLAEYDHDGLLPSMAALPAWLEAHLGK
jgi:phosphonatase-like hydrolase